MLDRLMYYGIPLSLLAITAALLWSIQDDPCNQAEYMTDLYIECVYGEVDLTPTEGD